jgi:hypothetical protein
MMMMQMRRATSNSVVLSEAAWLFRRGTQRGFVRLDKAAVCGCKLWFVGVGVANGVVVV